MHVSFLEHDTIHTVAEQSPASIVDKNTGSDKKIKIAT